MPSPYYLGEIYNRMRAKVSGASTEDESEHELNIKCTYCTRRQRVLNFSTLQEGDHICLGGENLIKNIGDRQVSLYTHHAIVVSVDQVAKTSANLTLVHFITRPFDSDLKIRKTTELKDLNHDEIYVIKYRQTTHTRKEIVRRAETFLKQDVKYSLLSCNCEHLCNWCCMGSENSFQVKSLRDRIEDVLAGIGNIPGRLIEVLAKVVLISLEDLVKENIPATVLMPWGVLSGKVLLHLIYCIYTHTELDKEFRSGDICACCCRRQKQDHWLRFTIYCVMQVGGLGLLSWMGQFSHSLLASAGLMSLMSVMSLLLMWKVPKLKSKLCSPFEGRLKIVKDMRNIWIADVISFDHWNFSHDGIVSAVRYTDRKRKQGEITVIHYSQPSIFGRREIVEDKIEIDLERDHIVSHDYSKYRPNIYKPEKVLERARLRLGEKKHGFLTNRSCHFCHWAKMKEEVDDDVPMTDPTAELQFRRSYTPGESISMLPQLNADHRRNKLHATKTLEYTWARIRDDVKPGQIIEFYWGNKWHKGVSTFVVFGPEPSQLTVTLVHLSQLKRITEDIFFFDLNVVDIWIMKMPPMFRFPQEEVVCRARARLDEHSLRSDSLSSSMLAREIVSKDKDTRITDISRLKPGDAISFYYWSVKHEAIVTEEPESTHETNAVGKVKIIHYSLRDEYFATWTIREEVLTMDLRIDHVYKINYYGYVTYPMTKVIERARSRLEEQRYDTKSNSSGDFVHWAKVIQTPVIVERFHLERGRPGKGNQKYLLMPRCGTPSDKFQTSRVHVWKELQPGMIVEYKYYWIWHQGILTSAEKSGEGDNSCGTIRIIHYGADNLIATRTVMEDTLQVDLRYHNLWAYRTDPTMSNTPDVILQKARARLGEQKWGSGNKSWDFCRQCVLKQRTRSLTRD